tara:strand:- start:1188 stop:1415 length:228 start_codon:yes stop_codon:yes gene_type:complete
VIEDTKDDLLALVKGDDTYVPRGVKVQIYNDPNAETASLYVSIGRRQGKPKACLVPLPATRRVIKKALKQMVEGK